MEKSALIGSDVNYEWNFLNYPIHTVSAKPEQTLKEYAILLIRSWVYIYIHEYKEYKCLSKCLRQTPHRALGRGRPEFGCIFL